MVSPCSFDRVVSTWLSQGPVYDFVQHAIGEAADAHGHFQLQRPYVKIRNQSGDIVETVRSNVPDLILTTTTLQESATVQRGAVLFTRFRRGQPFPGEPALVWTINGEKGELRIVARGGTALHANAYTDEVTFEIHNFETDEVQPVEWSWQPWQEELPYIARSVGALYEAFADGRTGVDYPSFKDALRRHEQLENLLLSFESEND